MQMIVLLTYGKWLTVQMSLSGCEQTANLYLLFYLPRKHSFQICSFLVKVHCSLKFCGLTKCLSTRNVKFVQS